MYNQPLKSTKDRKKKTEISGIYFGDSTISSYGMAKQSIRYRGYSLVDLVAHSTFEEVVYLFLYSRLPSAPELDGFTAEIAAQREIPPELKAELEKLSANALPLNVMKTITDVLGRLEPEKSDN